MSEKQSYWTWLRSEQNIGVCVSYTIDVEKGPGGARYWMTRDLTVLVIGAAVGTQVKAVITNSSDPEKAGPDQVAYHVQLTPVRAGVYLGQVEGTLAIRNRLPSVRTWYPKISVQVDDDWQRDPMQSGSHIFGFNWEDVA